MGNIYGVANPLALPAVYNSVGGADVTLTAGSEVTIITTGAIAGLGPGDYYPFIWLLAAVLMGGTAPTALQFAFKLGAGSDVDTFVVAPATLIASATVLYAIPLVGVNSSTNWIGAGSTINITAKASTTAATLKNVGSRAIVALFRGPDAY